LNVTASKVYNHEWLMGEIGGDGEENYEDQLVFDNNTLTW